MFLEEWEDAGVDVEDAGIAVEDVSLDELDQATKK
jgi:hypothetical protein